MSHRGFFAMGHFFFCLTVLRSCSSSVLGSSMISGLGVIPVFVGVRV